MIYQFVKFAALFIVLATLTISCSPKPFVPVNEGREYGNPKTPLFVMHALEKNQWSLRRVDHHHVFKRFICFNYACRKMIGRSKTLLVISKKEYIKVIKKNAERGFFKSAPPVTQEPIANDKPIKKDSAVVSPKTEAIPSKPILKTDSLITLNEFLFETNSYKLKSEHFPELELLSKYLIKHPTFEVDITGHTDNTGEEKHNITLSTRRAESVAEFLVSQGVNYDKIVFKGIGSSKPVATNNTAEGRSQNRRVEILIHNPDK